jgi:hypothetical protein
MSDQDLQVEQGKSRRLKVFYIGFRVPAHAAGCPHKRRLDVRREYKCRRHVSAALVMKYSSHQRVFKVLLMPIEMADEKLAKGRW